MNPSLLHETSKPMQVIKKVVSEFSGGSPPPCHEFLATPLILIFNGSTMTFFFQKSGEYGSLLFQATLTIDKG